MEVTMYNLNDAISWIEFSAYSIKTISEYDNITDTQRIMLTTNADILKDVIEELEAVNKRIIEQQEKAE